MDQLPLGLERKEKETARKTKENKSKVNDYLTKAHILNVKCRLEIPMMNYFRFLFEINLCELTN